MPTWIMELIDHLGPLASTAEGVVKIVEAAVKEVTSTDDVGTKAATVVSDVAQAATDIDAALHANATPPDTTAAPSPQVA